MSDPRVTLARPDLADAALQGLIRAERFALTTAYRCAVPAAAIRRAPDAGAEQWDQLLFGEGFAVIETGRAWGWGQAARDGYVGYVRMADLAAGAVEPTHRVAALRAYAFSRPDIKSAPVGLYSLNALVCVEAEEGRFLKAGGSGWLAREQLAPAGLFETDPAAVAERFVGAPYQWGGRESLGLDCSGLVQQALYACGAGCPRDSDMQAMLGQAVERGALRRNDLVFWRGHVGVMLDPARLLHANAFHMQVEAEPLAEAIARIGEPTALRRIAP
ncbi:MAG: hydrolase Nlp/P60 [Caulobacteraceae bacterium]|jgi:cell wall-associated NlpC family hydrolase|nr:hydrolase Nlp/P60 [Caulobacteraceae bacterium]